MFLKRLDISRKELTFLGIGTLVCIAAFILLILLMGSDMNAESTDVDIFGYGMTVREGSVDIRTRLDGDFTIEYNEDTAHDISYLNEKINFAYDAFLLSLRNALILIYVIFFIFVLRDKKETYFQGVFKGVLYGSALLLAFFLINNILAVDTNVVAFGHHLGHMLVPH